MTLILPSAAQEFFQADALAEFAEIRSIAEYSDNCRMLEAELNRLESLDEEDAPTGDALSRARAFAGSVLAGLGDSIPAARACVAFDYGVDIYWRGEGWSVQIHIPAIRSQEGYLYCERYDVYWIEHPNSDPDWCRTIRRSIPQFVGQFAWCEDNPQ